MEASITLKKVGKKIDDKTIVAGLTFGIERGSLVAIIGANDTGKSTLLRLLSGTEKPDYGSIFIHGLDMQKRKRKTRRLVGFVPHETDLDPWLTIEQNIRFSALLYNVGSYDYRLRLQSFSQILGIENFLHEASSKVSYGIQKRAMLVRALIHDPEILVLDEATSSLDNDTESGILATLEPLKKKKTLLIIAHRSKALEMCSKVFNLKDGNLKEI